MTRIEAKVRRAGFAIVLGLSFELLSLLPIQPLAFIAFVGLGVPTMVLGIVFFLLALVQPEAD